MSHIPTPATIDAAPEASRPMLEAIKKQLGSVPNIFRMMSNSPAVLGAYTGMSGALGKGALDAATRERIALAVGQLNGCHYCVSAHSMIAKNVAKLDADEIYANRRGVSNDARADAAVRFAVKIVQARGGVKPSDIDAVKAAGYSDEEVVEIVGHVAFATLTNYLNEVLGTELDFPPAAALAS